MLSPEMTARLRTVLEGEKKIDICAKVGIADGTLRKALHGHATLDVLKRVCEAYQIRLDWLIYGIGAETRLAEHERVVSEIVPREGLAALASAAADLERRMSSLTERALAVGAELDQLEESHRDSNGVLSK